MKASSLPTAYHCHRACSHAGLLSLRMQGEARAAQQEVTGSKKESEALRSELDRTKGMVGTLRKEITDLLSQATATEEKLTSEVCLPGVPTALATPLLPDVLCTLHLSLQAL